jgi:hypothetical protein
MAKCERIIIESEERDKERRNTLLQMKDPDQKSNPERTNEDSSPTVNGSMVDLIENFDDVRAQVTPNEKHSKPEDQLIFDFNS